MRQHRSLLIASLDTPDIDCTLRMPSFPGPLRLIPQDATRAGHLQKPIRSAKSGGDPGETSSAYRVISPTISWHMARTCFVVIAAKTPPQADDFVS
jgi:hypothetical protein